MKAVWYFWSLYGLIVKWLGEGGGLVKNEVNWYKGRVREIGSRYAGQTYIVGVGRKTVSEKERGDFASGLRD